MIELTVVEPMTKDPKVHQTPQTLSLYSRAMRCLGRSHYSGLFFGPLYGVLISLYIAFLILPGRPFTHTEQDKDFEPLITEQTGRYIGGGVGLASGLGLTGSSLISRRVRCTMVFVIPSLLTKRGRALLISVSVGLLVQGPFRTLRYNLREIGNSFTCMYDEAMQLSFHILKQFGEVLTQFQIILEEIRVLLDLYIKRLEADLSDEAKQELAKAKKSIENIKSAAEKAANTITFPDIFCSGVLSASSSMGTKIKKLSNKFGEYVSAFVNGNSQERRKKRDACAAIVELGEVSTSNVSIKDLEDILTKIGANVDLTKIKTTDQLAKEIDMTSVDYIRGEFRKTFERALEAVLLFSIWTSKILYLTILLLVYDAYYYLSCYYSDDTFDNMMVDGNLKQLKREKLTPLRHWEVQEQFYHVTDVLLTTNEFIGMIVTSLSSVLCTLLITLVVIGDFLMSAALMAFKDNSRFAISFPGLEPGASLSNTIEDTQQGDSIIQVEGYDLSLDPCIPNGHETPPGLLWPMYAVLLVCLVSCTLETYFSRARAIICNAFYEKRAEQRAIYLYDKLALRRKARYLELHTILRRHRRRKEREEEFACCRKLFCGRDIHMFSSCLACGVLFTRKEEIVEISFIYEDNYVVENVCKECNTEN